MKFCKKCGGLLLPSKNKKGETVFKCRKCGKKSKSVEESPVLKRKVNSKKGIPVIDTEKRAKKLSTISTVCPKCGHDRAIWWMMQTRSGDEPATRFFKCVKCGHQWRDYA